MAGRGNRPHPCGADPGKLPGLYVIETNAGGERRFYYWRENSAARVQLDLPQTSAILDTLSDYDLIYLSGITLSLYDAVGRGRLMGALDRARKAGRRVAFDTSFRPRNWPDRAMRSRPIATCSLSLTLRSRRSKISISCMAKAPVLQWRTALPFRNSC